MSIGGIDSTETEQKAHELLDQRMESVRALVHSRQHVNDLQEQLQQARSDDHTAYKAALKAGWTADELKRVGLPELEQQTRPRSNNNGTRNRSQNRSRQAAEQPTSENSDEGGTT